MGAVRTFAPHVKWSPAEVSEIRRLYANADQADLLSALPDRSLSQIQNKANGLGIVRAKKPKMTPAEVREAKRKHMEERRRSDPEKVRLYQKTKYHANRDKNLMTMKAYQKKRFFWMRSVKLKCVSAADLASLWKSQRGLCALTGRKLDRTAQLDHIVAKARGGNDALTNLRWLSKEANLALRELSDAEFLLLCSDVMAWIGQRIQMASEVKP